MKRILLLLPLLFCLFPASGQRATSTLRGAVLDAADNNPLVGALILVDSTRHATADLKGNFTVTGIERGERTVEITFLGYETVTRKVNFNQATVNLGTIRLKEEGRQIEAVTVSGQSTMAIQKGDTTQFNASAFKTNPDADAGDLVSKLPGAEVSDGTVTVQGEEVKRAYVDGKLFFGDDVMAAMRNLPAEAIESIQMFDELSDEAKFVGFDDGNRQRALNIVTKHKINRSTTGRIEAGYGSELDKDPDGNYQERYLVSGNVTTFTDKNRWSLNGTANNMNRANRSRGYGDGGGGGIRGGGLRTINSLGLNYSGTWTPELKFNADYSFNQNRSTRDSWNWRDYYTADRFTRDTTYRKTKDNGHDFGVRLEYEGKKDRIFFVARGEASDSESREENLKSTWFDEGDLLLKQPDIKLQNSAFGSSDQYSFRGNLMWMHKLGDKPGRTITLGVSGSHNDTDSEDDNLNRVLTGTGSENHIFTVSDTKGYTVGGRLSYAEPLSERSRLMATYRISYNDTESHVEATDVFTGERDDARTNIYNQNYLTQTGELGYTYSTKDFRMSTGIGYRTSERKRDQELPEIDDPNIKRTFRSWQPSLSARYTLGKSKYFDFRYSGEASQPSISNLQRVIRESTNGNLSAGNPDLKQSYSHSFRLRYNTSNTEKSTNFWVSANARLTRNSVASLIRYFDEDTILEEYYNYPALAGTELRTSVNLNGAVSLGSMAGYSFTIRSIGLNVNLMGGYDYDRKPSYTYVKATHENLLNRANTHGGNFRVGFVSNISENIDFDISSFTRLSYVHNTEGENVTNWNESVTARFNVIFLGGFTWNTNFSWRYQNTKRDGSDYSTGSNTTNSYIWNMGLGYKFLRRKTAEFRITMYDLLDQSQKAPRTSAGDTYYSTSWTRSMGRYITGTLSYRFNTMNRQGNNSRTDTETERRMGPGGPGMGSGMGSGRGHGHGSGGGF